MMRVLIILGLLDLGFASGLPVANKLDVNVSLVVNMKFGVAVCFLAIDSPWLVI